MNDVQLTSAALSSGELVNSLRIARGAANTIKRWTNDGSTQMEALNTVMKYIDYALASLPPADAVWFTEEELAAKIKNHCAKTQTGIFHSILHPTDDGETELEAEMLAAALFERLPVVGGEG